jgi:integral membrane protein (TIGR01906 family)
MKYTTVLIIVLIPMVIIFTNLALLSTNYNFYLQIYREQNVHSNFTGSTVLNEATSNLIGYFRGKNMLEQKFYSNQAILHLMDVKHLLNTALLLTICLDILLISTTIYAIIKKEVKKLLNAFLVGAVATIVLTLAVLGLLALDFENSFIYFHLAFFRNNYWLFDESDNLIKMFPQSFFVSFAYHLVANIIVTALVLSIAALMLKKINDKPHT